MKFNDLVSISGLSGLYQLVGSKADGAIVKNFDDDKTIFISARKHEVTPLKSIEVYTETDNVALSEVFLSFRKNEALVETLDVQKASNDVIKKTFATLFPEHDESRVYTSDMKKMLKWYGIIKKLDLLDGVEKEQMEKVGMEEEGSNKPNA